MQGRAFVRNAFASVLSDHVLRDYASPIGSKPKEYSGDMTERNYEQLAKALKSALTAGNREESLKLFLEGVGGDEDVFIEEIRKSGAFRCSAYNFVGHDISSLLNAYEERSPPFRANKDPELYFESVRALLYIAQSVRGILKSLSGTFDVNSFKGYLATVDKLFWFPRPHDYTRSSLRRCADDYPIEDLAEAFSYAYYQLTTTGDLGAVTLGHLDEAKVASGYYANRLAEYCGLLKFREAEILVDRFGYSASKVGSTVSIKAPADRLEMSIRLGYIHSENQQYADYGNFQDQVRRAPPLSLVCKSMVDKLGDIMFSINDKPIKRIVMQIPEIPKLRELIVGDDLYAEEYVQLAMIQKELLLTEQQLLTEPISESVTIRDVVKLQRLFRFLFWLFREHINTKGLQDDGLFYRSMLPVYPQEVFVNLMSSLYGHKMASEFCRLFVWEPQSQAKFDIQTKPIISINGRIVIPLGIMSQSNLVRNAMMHNRFRFDDDGKFDAMGKLLEASLKEAGAGTKRSVKYKYGECQGDVDVLAVWDNKVFAFECKASLQPCNVFELRTSYDYICKAGKQLTQFKHLFKVPDFRKYLGAKLGIHLGDDKNVHTCIVTGNRLFSGWIQDGHHVRPLHELCNMLESGTVIVRAIQGSVARARVVKYRTWKGDKFTPDDLITYIDGENLHRPRFGAMEPWSNSIMIGKKKLVFETYRLDMEKMIKLYSEQFPYICCEEANPFGNRAESGSHDKDW